LITSRHDNVTTRVNLTDYTYRDVIKTPVDDFDSFSSKLTSASVDSSDYLENSWIFPTPIEEALKENRRLTDEALLDKEYMPSPFPEHLLFDDHEWMHILASLDTCTIPRGPQFCDEDGNDIIPI